MSVDFSTAHPHTAGVEPAELTTAAICKTKTVISVDDQPVFETKGGQSITDCADDVNAFLTSVITAGADPAPLPPDAGAPVAAEAGGDAPNKRCRMA